MSLIPISSEVSDKRDTFFRFIYGQGRGYVCLSRLQREPEKVMHEEFFKYPDDLPAMLEFVNRWTISEDVYFCPNLFDVRKRVKENASSCPNAWADLDGCEPERLLVPPSVVLESSPGRYQGLWVFKQPQDPFDAEDVSRRIAYAHLDDGADKSGWDLTQLLRVPLTYNHKHGSASASPPLVKIIKVKPGGYELTDFGMYPEAEGYSFTKIPMPEQLELPPGTAEEIVQNHRFDIPPQAIRLLTETPEEHAWSQALWALMLLLFEAGLNRGEIFVVCQGAACNKYARDNRGLKPLWQDVCRAEAHHLEPQRVLSPRDEILEPLLTEEERTWVESNPTIIEEYIEWAKTVGDAAWQYHQVGAFAILSSLLAGPVRLPTSFGTVIPNLWFMILADTTLTRKTTAMDMAMDILIELDPDCILATDGSIEGLMTSLSMRPGRPSIFLRDEFSGLLDAMTKKEYMAGMAETLTKLYDGKFQKRILRKEIIEVREPILILFAGGIKTRILQLLEYEHVASGFLPRFCFVTAESDVTRLRPLGPPTEQDVAERTRILESFRTISRHYRREATVDVEGRITVMQKQFQAKLTPEAWLRYNTLESQMLEVGMRSQHKDLMTPTMDRLSKSGLKIAVLLAAATRLEENIVIDEQDIVRAFYYIEQWRLCTIEVLSNIGKSTKERELDLIIGAIRRVPGVHRSVLMRNYHLDARTADLVFGTLEQRGLVSRVRSGKTERLYPVDI